MDQIHVGDVLISHKGNYHYLVESFSGNDACILWLERLSGEPLDFYTYRRKVHLDSVPIYYDVIPATRVDRSSYRGPGRGWPSK